MKHSDASGRNIKEVRQFADADKHQVQHTMACKEKSHRRTWARKREWVEKMTLGPQSLSFELITVSSYRSYTSTASR